MDLSIERRKFRMFEIKEKPRMVERAFLVGVHTKQEDSANASSLLTELGELVSTLGIQIVGSTLARVIRPLPRLYVGTGKADEILAMAKDLDAEVIVFDNELSPAQQRNWETLSKLCVIDRHEVILDIFAGRAQTKEARLQVGLARMEYSLPRLKRAWTHLSRQGGASGGLGGKGEGETQLETDRRLVRKRIDRLKAELVEVRSQRATQRKQRERVPFPLAAIVGYTNAGKSSLLRKLTDADVLVADKLFATLDPTTRRLDLPNNQTVLLTDTVGFVRNLPHGLVEAFKATLEEAVRADFLIHLIDASSPMVLDLHRTTMSVLSELDATEKPVITVFNKLDRPGAAEAVAELRLHFPEALFVSAITGEGLDALLAKMESLLSDRVSRVELFLPHERSDLVSMLHRGGNVYHTEYLDDGIRLLASVPPRLKALCEPYMVPSRSSGIREGAVREELSV